MSKADGEKLKRKQYEKELDKLQVELCHLQDWVKTTGERITVSYTHLTLPTNREV